MREAYGEIRHRLFEVWRQASIDVKGRLTEAGFAALEAALEAEGAKHRKSAGRGGATILVGVEQAKEMARATTR